MRYGWNDTALKSDPNMRLGFGTVVSLVDLDRGEEELMSVLWADDETGEYEEQIRSSDGKLMMMLNGEVLEGPNDPRWFQGGDFAPARAVRRGRLRFRFADGTEKIATAQPPGS